VSPCSLASRVVEAAGKAETDSDLMKDYGACPAGQKTVAQPLLMLNTEGPQERAF